MLKSFQVIFILFFLSFSGCAQNEKQDYQGEWVGFLSNKHSFNFKVSLEKLEGRDYRISIDNDKNLIDTNITSSDNDSIIFDIDKQLFFNLGPDQDGKALTGFIKSGRFFYHVSFPKVAKNKFAGAWYPFMLDDKLQSTDINLYIENTEDGNIVAYPFLGDQRFRGFYAEDFKLKEDTLLFKDQNTGFNFRATLKGETIQLEIFLIDVLLAKTNLKYSKDGWEYSRDPVDKNQSLSKPARLNDGWETASIDAFGIDKKSLQSMIDSIHGQKLVNIHSVLIAKENELVFENYFDGFNVNIPHDTRSASKSIASAMIGIAIEDGILESVDQNLYELIPEKYQYTKDSLKSEITIQDLLTMSSGLDVNNQASENYYQNQSNSTNWLKTVLEAPMVKTPGTYADYGSANPFLLGVGLSERLEKPLEVYINEKLFAPLGITNYILNADDTENKPYFGGGMLLIPRDLLKFGQLYLNKGKWEGNQVIPENWVEKSFKKYGRLQDYEDKNQYGYLWWHDTYIVDGREIESIEARGAGGQFIFIVPELETVCVVTAGNFRNRKGNQSREIFRDYILPSLVN